jgi:hypothetical protein
MYFNSVISESTKPPYFHSSMSVPFDMSQVELSICDQAASFPEQKKFDLINRFFLLEFFVNF